MKRGIKRFSEYDNDQVGVDQSVKNYIASLKGLYLEALPTQAKREKQYLEADGRVREGTDGDRAYLPRKPVHRRRLWEVGSAPLIFENRPCIYQFYHILPPPKFGFAPPIFLISLRQ